ncbi:MAG: ABC transporter ATP-binding protein [Desulfobacteraceae bacterium]|nr:MAG: ABC transporter ATP-binding protein [Desulfobacteraceae bacterium]
MEALRIKGLSKNFGGVSAVDSISFGVEIGERLVIIGPNGAGKTTLFNLINGQLPATSGRIYFLGKDITAMPTHSRAHLGQARAFQIISLFLNLSVLDNALLALHGTKPYRFKLFRPINHYKLISDKVQETLKELDLWEKKDELVKNLSYGEQRRMEIGLSLALQPKLLLLDEPSAGLTMEECSGIIDMIKNLGLDITVIIVDHDMDLVFGVAERIIVLHYGQIIADGAPEQIQADPRVKEIYLGIEE